MLLIVISWIVITVICFSWGTLFMRLTSGSFTHPNMHFSITCLTGCVVIAAFYSVISFFLPIGNISMQIPLFAPVIILLLSLKKINFQFLWSEFCRLIVALKLLLTLATALILIMSSWYISHPDSLEYHLPIIKWIEEFRIVPGIANLNPRLGFQSLWFVLSAVLSYNFLGTGSYIYLNSTIIIWFITFVIHQINKALTLQHNARAILWITLLLLSFLSYTQIRLTVTSPSPDFIVAIYLLAVFFLLLNSPDLDPSATPMLVIILSFFAVTIKLSALPILLPGTFILFKMISRKQVKKLIGPAIIILVLSVSFLTRNLITSGFLLYPSTFPDIVTKEWKTNKHETDLQATYVTTYARTESGFSKQAIAETKKMRISTWLPIWWHQRSIPDKLILMLLLPALVFLPLYVIKKGRNIAKIQVVCILSSLTGVLFWFVMASHPRFGFGFILAVTGIAINLCVQNISFRIKDGIIFTALLLGNITIASYIIHRVQHYFSKNQIIKPLGIQVTPYSSAKMKNVSLKFSKFTSSEQDIILLSWSDSTGAEVLPIGNKIEDGFFVTSQNSK